MIVYSIKADLKMILLKTIDGKDPDNHIKDTLWKDHSYIIDSIYTMDNGVINMLTRDHNGVDVNLTIMRQFG